MVPLFSVQKCTFRKILKTVDSLKVCDGRWSRFDGTTTSCHLSRHCDLESMYARRSWHQFLILVDSGSHQHFVEPYLRDQKVCFDGGSNDRDGVLSDTVYLFDELQDLCSIVVVRSGSWQPFQSCQGSEHTRLPTPLAWLLARSSSPSPPVKSRIFWYAKSAGQQQEGYGIDGPMVESIKRIT